MLQNKSKTKRRKIRLQKLHCRRFSRKKEKCKKVNSQGFYLGRGGGVGGTCLLKKRKMKISNWTSEGNFTEPRAASTKFQLNYLAALIVSTTSIDFDQNLSCWMLNHWMTHFLTDSFDSFGFLWPKRSPEQRFAQVDGRSCGNFRRLLKPRWICSSFFERNF